MIRREAKSRYAVESSLHDLLAELIEEIRSRTPFDRMVAVAGARSFVATATYGVPEEEAALFERAVLRAGPTDSLGARVVPAMVPESALAALESLRAAVVLGSPVVPGGSLAAVVAEADPDHADLGEVREALARVAAQIVQAAETEGMRHTVEGLELRLLRSRSALAALPDPVLVMDNESRILLANQRAEDLLVVDPDDSTGRRHAVETNNLFFSAFRARAILDRGRRVAPRELFLVDPTYGSDLLFEATVLPFHDSEGQTDSSIFVLRDITDLKQATLELEVQFGRSVAAEHEARRESERLNVIIENAGVPIFVTDPRANVILLNREAERLLAAGDVASRSSPRVTDIRNNDAKLAGFINEFMLQRRLEREERLTLVDPDEARELPVLAVSTKILDDHYEPTAVVTVLRDLTQEVQNRHLALELSSLNAELEERVRAATQELADRNELLERQSTQLERASRMKTEFLATMSHELRTPINAVLGYNSLLREGLFGDPTPRQQDALQRMRNAAEHLLALINDILDLTRVEAGHLHVSATDIDVPTFLESISESVRPMAAEKSLDYAMSVEPGVGSIRTDEMRLRQVLLNLLSNAVKFTDSGRIEVHARTSAGGERLILEVIDTGPGIHEAYLDSIFEEFTQADQSATRRHGGAGLGLAISRKLIRLMGGTLQVTSTLGTGTSFSVELPVQPPPDWGSGRTQEGSAEGLDAAPAPVSPPPEAARR